MSDCRTDIIAAAADLRAHLKHVDAVHSVGLHGEGKKIVVRAEGNWPKQIQARNLEKQGWFGWPVQVVGVG